MLGNDKHEPTWPQIRPRDGVPRGSRVRTNRYDRGLVKGFFQTRGLRFQRTEVVGPLSSGGEKALRLSATQSPSCLNRQFPRDLPNGWAVEQGEILSDRYSECPSHVPGGSIQLYATMPGSFPMARSKRSSFYELVASIVGSSPAGPVIHRTAVAASAGGAAIRLRLSAGGPAAASRSRPAASPSSTPAHAWPSRPPPACGGSSGPC